MLRVKTVGELTRKQLTAKFETIRFAHAHLNEFNLDFTCENHLFASASFHLFTLRNQLLESFALHQEILDYTTFP